MCGRDLWMTLLLLAGVSWADDTPKERPSVREPELRDELVRRARADHEVRGEITKWMNRLGNKQFSDEPALVATLNTEQKDEFQKFADRLQKVDAENTARLGEIIDRHGWPTCTLVGREGADAAWLLVQHADRSPKFQRKCLDLMAKLPRNEVSPSDLAYLTDRVLLAEGKKQVYGTQFVLTDGKFEPRPIEDEANVDQRRKAVGLPPLAEYRWEIESFYAPAGM